MNQVPIIRKGAIKDYWNVGFRGGFLFGILMGLGALVNNSAYGAIYAVFVSWGLIIVIWVGVGFTSEEYFKRKQRIRKLHGAKYASLDEQGFRLHPDLFFEGVYKGFFFRVLPFTKWVQTKRGRGKYIEYVAIESFYIFDSDLPNAEWTKSMSGDYFLGHVQFTNYYAGFVPKDWQNPDFIENFDGLINIFRRQKLRPLLINGWEEKQAVENI